MEIRNFCIIAHIDHGKSTLADRFLEITRAVPQNKLREQFLDMMDLEREKRVTIKMQPVRMRYHFFGKDYILNLIDTPGHVDFSYEVSRALDAVEGAILLVDAQKGIQAQTLYNFQVAKKEGLKIIPALNKIDLNPPDIEEKRKILAALVGVPEKKVSLVSAKRGKGVEDLLARVVREVPPPEGNENAPFSALIFDSEYSPHLGIVIHVRVKDGTVKKSNKCILHYQKEKFEVKSLGIFSPYKKETEELKKGEIGWLATGIKEPARIFVGDTVANLSDFEKSKKYYIFKGFKKPEPVVFANLYPFRPEEYILFKKSLEKIHLTDPSLVFHSISTALGRGFLVGFLGLFHLEIITKRLEKEYGVTVAVTLPTVLYKIVQENGKVLDVTDVSKLPPLAEVKEILEPKIKLEVIVPQKFLNNVMSLPKMYRLSLIRTKSFNKNILLEFRAPLAKVIQDFDDVLKSRTEGFGSFSYTLEGWEKEDIVKLEILVAHEPQPSLSFLIEKSEAEKRARDLTTKLKENLPCQQFPVIIQGAINGRIVARQTLPALKKNVTAPLYGGDFSRKKKLLVKQRKGKKKLLKMGKVRIPSEVFIKILKK